MQLTKQFLDNSRGDLATGTSVTASFNSPLFAAVVLPCVERFEAGFVKVMGKLSVAVNSQSVVHTDQAGHRQDKVVTFTVTTKAETTKATIRLVNVTAHFYFTTCRIFIQSKMFIGMKGKYSMSRFLLSHFLLPYFQEYIELNNVTTDSVDVIRATIMRLNSSRNSSTSENESSRTLMFDTGDLPDDAIPPPAAFSPAAVVPGAYVESEPAVPPHDDAGVHVQVGDEPGVQAHPRPTRHRESNHDDEEVSTGDVETGPPPLQGEQVLVHAEVHQSAEGETSGTGASKNNNLFSICHQCFIPFTGASKPTKCNIRII